MFRRINWLAILLTTALLYFGASAAPALTRAPPTADFTSAR
ncbi:hypothetical protein U91I_00712 [alpha proteobacterium U9-1i]|nr:hypothetical protein U91I_00712 [alpha proteobacterium U9-1i]